MTRQYFAETYELNAPKNYEQFFVPTIGAPLAKDLVRIADLKQGERVLDVACGTGIVTRLASQKTGSTGTVTGLDINPGMLAVARSVSPVESTIEWCEASAGEIPLPDGSYDVVICQLGLQFMEDKSGALKEMFRVLTPGGRIVMNLPGPAGRVFSILAESMEQHIGAEAAGFVKQVFSLHERTEIRLLFDNAGFNKIDIQATNKMFSLPPPKKFLWQYIYSTPLAGALADADEGTRKALEEDVVKQWQEFLDDGAFLYRQRVVTINACK